MKLRILITFTLIVAVSTLSAATINFTSLGSQWEDSSGVPLNDGSQILIGNFNTLEEFKFSLIGTAEYDTYSEVSVFFTQYGADVTETSFGTTAGVQDGGRGDSDDTGSSIYFWAFNNPDVTLATEWAIVSNTDSSWLVPSDPTPGSTEIDLGVNVDTRTIEFGSLSSNESPIGEVFNVQTGLVVPEPSTYALIAGIFTLGYIIIRRSRA